MPLLGPLGVKSEHSGLSRGYKPASLLKAKMDAGELGKKIAKGGGF